MNFISSVVPPTHVKESLWFIFKDNKLIVKEHLQCLTIPFLSNEEISSFNLCYVNYLGTYKSFHCYTAALQSENLNTEIQLKELRMLFGLIDDDMYSVACRAFEIVHWDKTHQFCGQCGSAMTRSSIDLSKTCPVCKMQNYPRISPAIIVAIIRDDKILLARGPDSDIFSVIAGYVEIGETLEEAVKRETMEEVNIEVNNIRYFTSQPWVFSHALMIAYTAEYLKGELKVDGNEIEEAAWFNTSNMPSKMPRPLSVSRKLIDWFLMSNSLK